MLELLLLAGEAPVPVIGNGVCALLHQPDVLAHLRDHPTEIAAVVEELLRFEGGDDHVRYRIATEDVTLDEVSIPRGSIVKLILASANRDERAFPEPDRLRLDRRPNRHVAFGRGLHICLGAPLARLECQVAIQTLVGRTRTSAWPVLPTTPGGSRGGWTAGRFAGPPSPCGSRAPGSDRGDG
jgi:cytochrome P450